MPDPQSECEFEVLMGDPFGFEEGGPLAGGRWSWRARRLVELLWVIKVEWGNEVGAAGGGRRLCGSVWVVALFVSGIIWN